MPGAYLHLRRVRQWRSCCRRFRVELDGRRLDGIMAGVERTYPIEPGDHALVVSIDWVSSPKAVFHCRPGQHVRFVCRHPDPSWRMVLRPGEMVSAIELLADESTPDDRE